MAVSAVKSPRLPQLEQDLVDVNAKIRAIVTRQSKASSGVLSTEMNKLLAQQRNIRININQEKQKSEM